MNHKITQLKNFKNQTPKFINHNSTKQQNFKKSQFTTPK